MTEVLIRGFQKSDSQRLVEILQLNGQYRFPAIEGPEAMQRVAACAAAVFLVAEVGGQPCGLVKAVYDGSRALIHLLSVHPDHQNAGIGSALVDAVCKELAHRGAPSFSVSVTEKSACFWEKMGFVRMPVFLMLKESS